MVTYIPPALRRISWTAIGTGVGVALLIELLFSIYGHLRQLLMGVGVGIGTIDPTRLKMLITPELSGITGFCWQSFALIALLIGSGVASHMAAASYRHEGMLHGLLTWGVVMLCILCVPTTVLGNFMSRTLTTQITVQTSSFGMIPVPLVGALVAALGGVIGTLRNS